MKRIYPGYIREWFGFTRRERRSSFILLLIIAALAGIRFIIPSREMPVEMIPLEVNLVPADSNNFNDNDKQQDVTQIRRSGRKVPAIDLNKCDSSDLEALPGIGPVLSARIIKYRNLLGGYASVSQLKEVYGLSGEVYDLIVPRVTADPADVVKTDLNRADYRQLIRMPYLERYDVTAVLKYREIQGTVKSCDELVESGILTPEKAEKLKWYLEFGK